MGAGRFYGVFAPEPDSLIIAADGGLDTLKKLNIRADIIIGDFDSASERPSGANVITLPTVKDDTDTLAAVRLGLERGCKFFHIFGGTGGRGDHTLANIQTLAFLCAKGANGRLYGEGGYMEMLEGRRVCFNAEKRGHISVFAYGGNARVTLLGLKYTLDDAVLTPDFPIGVSNEFTGIPSAVEVSEGRALIYVEDTQ